MPYTICREYWPCRRSDANPEDDCEIRQSEWRPDVLICRVHGDIVGLAEHHA